MAKKRRNEDIYEIRSKQAHRNQRRRQSHKKRKKRPKSKAHLFLIGLVAIVLTLFFYQLYIRKPEVTINKAVLAIKDDDLKKQEDYFDKISNINEILGSAYSEDEEEREEFLKSNYSNLEVKVKSKEKTENGLIVKVEVSNIDFLEVLDSIKTDDSSFHRTYMQALEKENIEKNKTEAKLILKRRFSGYKIYEDKDFVDGILGGVLKENNQ
ncbi:MAG: hypothetical protein ACTIH2_05130 [Anaerococcus sp.]